MSLEALQKAVKKARVALGMLQSISGGSYSDDLHAETKLFDSIVAVTSLYGIEMWGLNYLDKVQVVQVAFYWNF